MRSKLNDRQVEVLEWIAKGHPVDEVPTPSFKNSALVLRDRGLINLDRWRNRWKAIIRDDGRHYLEFGTYPTDERQSSLEFDPQPETLPDAPNEPPAAPSDPLLQVRAPAGEPPEVSYATWLVDR